MKTEDARTLHSSHFSGPCGGNFQLTGTKLPVQKLLPSLATEDEKKERKDFCGAMIAESCARACVLLGDLSFVVFEACVVNHTGCTCLSGLSRPNLAQRLIPFFFFIFFFIFKIDVHADGSLEGVKDFMEGMGHLTQKTLLSRTHSFYFLYFDTHTKRMGRVEREGGWWWWVSSNYRSDYFNSSSSSSSSSRAVMIKAKINRTYKVRVQSKLIAA